MANKIAYISMVKSGKLKGKFKFRLAGTNGDTVAHSPEVLENYGDCIDTLAANFPDFEIKEEKAGIDSINIID